MGDLFNNVLIHGDKALMFTAYIIGAPLIVIGYIYSLSKGRRFKRFLRSFVFLFIYLGIFTWRFSGSWVPHNSYTTVFYYYFAGDIVALWVMTLTMIHSAPSLYGRMFFWLRTHW